MTAELKGIHAKTFQNLDVIKDVLKLDEEKIVELEKENAELKQSCDKTQELLDKQIEATYKLDVKNAELRKDCIESEEDNNKLRENIQKLTKAKDLLLRFIELKDKPCASGHSVNMLLYENICADVKQFLNEVEKC